MSEVLCSQRHHPREYFSSHSCINIYQAINRHQQTLSASSVSQDWDGSIKKVPNTQFNNSCIKCILREVFFVWLNIKVVCHAPGEYSSLVAFRRMKAPRLVSSLVQRNEPDIISIRSSWQSAIILHSLHNLWLLLFQGSIWWFPFMQVGIFG